MSNPGVITLAETMLATRKNFRVEDNLAESIHFHYRDIRIDLTIRELEQIAKICDYTIHDLVKVENFDLSLYDANFLIKHAADFIDLVKIEEVVVPVSDLYVISEGALGCPRYKKFSNRISQRILAISEKKSMPVIFNDQKILLTGESAVALQYIKNPSAEMRINRFVFDNRLHSLPSHPVLNAIFIWNKKKIKKCLWKLAGKIF